MLRSSACEIAFSTTKTVVDFWPSAYRPGPEKRSTSRRAAGVKSAGETLNSLARDANVFADGRKEEACPASEGEAS
jgi:hypothetical protein